MLSECGIQHGAELSIVLQICGCKIIEEELKNLSANSQHFYEEVESNKFSSQETELSIYRPGSSIRTQPSKDGTCGGEDWLNVGVLSEHGFWTEHGGGEYWEAWFFVNVRTDCPDFGGVRVYMSQESCKNLKWDGSYSPGGRSGECCAWELDFLDETLTDPPFTRFLKFIEDWCAAPKRRNLEENHFIVDLAKRGLGRRRQPVSD